MPQQVRQEGWRQRRLSKPEQRRQRREVQHAVRGLLGVRDGDGHAGPGSSRQVAGAQYGGADGPVVRNPHWHRNGLAG